MREGAARARGRASTRETRGAFPSFVEIQDYRPIPWPFGSMGASSLPFSKSHRS